MVEVYDESTANSLSGKELKVVFPEVRLYYFLYILFQI